MGLDLSLLKPMWQMYNKMSEDSPEAGSVLTPVVRALTELFFVAEDLALVSLYTSCVALLSPRNALCL